VFKIIGAVGGAHGSIPPWARILDFI